MSLSSIIVSIITAFRNPNGSENEWTEICYLVSREKANPLKVIAAEVGYIAAIPFAIVETALSAIAKLFSICFPIGQKNHDAMSKWLRSSAFSVVWAIGDATINLFCNDMIETEGVAKACAFSGNILTAPMEDPVPVPTEAL